MGLEHFVLAGFLQRVHSAADSLHCLAGGRRVKGQKKAGYLHAFVEQKGHQKRRYDSIAHAKRRINSAGPRCAGHRRNARP